MTKYIVNKDHIFCDAWRCYEAGDVVDIDEKKIKAGENLRKLTAEDMKLKPSELKAREIAEPEAAVEEAVAA